MKSVIAALLVLVTCIGTGSASAQMGGQPSDISKVGHQYPKWAENPDKLYGDNPADKEGLAYEMVMQVRRAGYDCKTVSQTGPRPFADGWNLYCDEFTRAYVLEPVGQSWKVSVR